MELNTIKTCKIQAKEKKGEFLGMLLGTLDATFLENLLKGEAAIRADKGTIRAAQDF